MYESLWRKQAQREQNWFTSLNTFNILKIEHKFSRSYKNEKFMNFGEILTL